MSWRQRLLSRIILTDADLARELAAIRSCLTPGIRSFQFTTWSDITSGAFSPAPSGLVIVTGNPGLAESGKLLRLAGQGHTPPLLAILPADSGEDTIRMAADAADDFVVFPFSGEELRHRVGRLLRQPQHVVQSVRRQLLEELGLSNLVGRDEVFLQAVRQIPRFARSDAPVCITGETGTGKELCARALHQLSRRQRSSFIGIDCGALPEPLFENEMFGHARGAFTDAHRDQKGLVAMADGGTLFLDEIDALSLASQAKLLRFLQERSYRPLGSDQFQSADVRVIAATNRDLECVVREGRFRSDLFFRLNVLRLRLPALRDRQGDVELLAHAALKFYWPAEAGPAPEFSAAAARSLAEHPWPGNVRELYNVVQRAVVACEGGPIVPAHLDLPSIDVVEDGEPDADFRTGRAAAVADFERRYVEGLLRKHNGNVTHAAREARQDRRAFGRFIKKYNIDRRTLIA